MPGDKDSGPRHDLKITSGIEGSAVNRSYAGAGEMAGTSATLTRRAFCCAGELGKCIGTLSDLDRTFLRRQIIKMDIGFNIGHHAADKETINDAKLAIMEVIKCCFDCHLDQENIGKSMDTLSKMLSINGDIKYNSLSNCSAIGGGGDIKTTEPSNDE